MHIVIKMLPGCIGYNLFRKEHSLKKYSPFFESLWTIVSNVLTLLLPEGCCAGDNTDLPSNSNTSKTVEVNIAFTGRFLKKIR